jgi:hypothetical protein
MSFLGNLFSGAGAAGGAAAGGGSSNFLEKLLGSFGNKDMSTMDRIGSGLNQIASAGGAEQGYASGQGIPGLQIGQQAPNMNPTINQANMPDPLKRYQNFMQTFSSQIPYGRM